MEELVSGMKTGDKRRLDLPPDLGFGPYETNKKKTAPRLELPGGTKEGDILKDPTGQQATVTELSDTCAVGRNAPERGSDGSSSAPSTCAPKFGED